VRADIAEKLRFRHLADPIEKISPPAKILRYLFRIVLKDDKVHPPQLSPRRIFSNSSINDAIVLQICPSLAWARRNR